MLCTRQLEMLVSLTQTNPELVQQMGRVRQQILVEVQRMEKLAQLKVVVVVCVVCETLLYSLRSFMCHQPSIGAVTWSLLNSEPRKNN